MALLMVMVAVLILDCVHVGSVTANPQYSLECSKATTITVTLAQTAKEPFDTIGLYVCKVAVDAATQTASELGPGLSPVVSKGFFGKGAAPERVCTQVRPKNAAGAVGVKKESQGGGASGGGAQRVKILSSKMIVAKSEFSSDKEACCVFKANPKCVCRRPFVCAVSALTAALLLGTRMW